MLIIQDKGHLPVEYIAEDGLWTKVTSIDEDADHRDRLRIRLR